VIPGGDATLRFGRYEVIRPLARGGMAELFLARRVGPEGVEKRLCIKKIRAELARERRFLDLFVAEARVSTSLTHGNIVQVFDFGRAGDDYYLAMEYVPGRDLGAVLRALRAAGRGLAPPLAAHVASEVCNALDYAHRQRGRDGQPLGLVHRDVTPRNVLLSWDGEVKLADFGVSRVGEPLVGGVRGTPAYMAPEQARGDAVDARSDLFAVGLVLLEALRGERAYAAESPEAQLEQARRAEVPDPPPEAPAALREVVTRATAQEPGARFANALEMQTALERYLKGVHDAPPSSRALAALLAELFPGETEDDHAPAGGDGGPGVRTALSVAGTVAEAPAPPPAPARGPAPSRRGRRAAVAVAALVGLAALSGAVFLCSRPLAPDVPRTSVATPPSGEPVAAASAPASVPAPATAPAPQPPPSAAIVAKAPANGQRHVAPARPGTLDLNCTPWCEVVVDGRRVGESPLLGLSLPAGRHKVRVRNPKLNVSRTLAVEIRPGEVTRQLVDLAAAP
jgi:tRNA A-37 threonylcarbamoyl transferase component Bud32